MRIKNKKIDEFFKKLPVSKNYETKITLNKAFLTGHFCKRKRNNTACIAPLKLKSDRILFISEYEKYYRSKKSEGKNIYYCENIRISDVKIFEYFIGDNYIYHK